MTCDAVKGEQSSDGVLSSCVVFTDAPEDCNKVARVLRKLCQLNGEKLNVLTHHNGLDDTGSTINTLFDQVMNAFPGGGPAYWYWGHEHFAAVYKPQGPAGVLCCCCGHGALPWGQASSLANSPNVVWHENRPANDPDKGVHEMQGS
jgi:hypothetical protein